MTLEDRKKLLRREMRALRMDYPAGKASQDSRIIQERLYALEAYRKAEAVLCYVSCRNEPETRPLIIRALEEGKKVGVPRVEGPSRMRFLRIRSLSELAEGHFGVMEPSGESLEELTEGFVITPGLAFDRKMARLGYGGGYYDAWFAAHGWGVISCGIGYDFQLVDKVPCGPKDCRLDQVITPGGL